MGLRDYVTPREIVSLPGGNNFSVRGLNLDDFAILLQQHLEPVSKAVDLYEKSKSDIFSTKNLQSFVLTVAKDFPTLVSEVISIAADEPDAKNVKLGIGLQLSALNAITNLTLEEAGGLGNLLASLAALGRGVVDSAREAARNAGQPSHDSIGG